MCRGRRISATCCSDRMAIGACALLAVFSFAAVNVDAQLPANHGIALSAQCESTTCVGSSLDCFVDVQRNDQCGDAIIVHFAHAHINDPNHATEYPLVILAATGNTTAVPGPLTGDVFLGAPGDTFGGLPGDPNEPIVTFGFAPNEYVVQPTDPNPSITTFHIGWEDTCDDFNHSPDCTDCPGGVTFEATTGAVFHPSPQPCCLISGPDLPGAARYHVYGERVLRSTANRRDV
jgi:hypothetical protein